MLRLSMLVMLVLLLAACEIDPIETSGGDGNTPTASGPSRASVSGIGNATKRITLGSGTYNCEGRVTGNSTSYGDAHASIWIKGDSGGALILNDIGTSLSDTSIERFSGGTYYVEVDAEAGARWSLVCSR